MKENRTEYIDIAKGIGIIAVMFSHAGYASPWIVPYYILMFAAASGCAFRCRDRDYRYCFKASRSLVKYYFLYSAAVFVLFMPLLFLTVETDERAGFIIRNLAGILYARKSAYYPYNAEPNITFLQLGNAPMWFLPFLAVSWLIFALIVKIAADKEKSASARTGILIVLLSACVILTVLLDDIPVLLPWSIDVAFMGAFFIAAGYMWEMLRGRYIASLKAGMRGRAVLFVMSAVLIFGYYLIYSRLNVFSNISVREFDSALTDNPLLLFPFAVYGIAMLFMICESISGLLIGRVLAFTGRSSLMLLCLHALVYKYYTFFESMLGCDGTVTSAMWYIIIKVSVTAILIIAFDFVLREYKRNEFKSKN